MVNSGLPILRALSILSEQTSTKTLAKILLDVRIDVERGESLSAAMAKHPKCFNDLFIAMVKSGETGGVLDTVLLNLADMIERDVELRRKIKSAMTYPVAVVCLVTLILAAMPLFVVPQFKTIYASLGGQLPLPTRMLLMRSNIVRTYWWMVIIGAVGSSFLFRRFKRTPAGRKQVDQVKLRVPVFGPLFHKVALARISSTFGMLLRAGVPILQALEIVKDTVNNRVMAGRSTT